MYKTGLSFFMFLFCSLCVVALPTVYVELDSQVLPTDVVNIFVVDPVASSDVRFFRDQTEDSAFDIVLEDKAGTEVSRDWVRGDSAMPFFDGSVVKIKLVSGSSVLAERDIRFCDSDGVCEPCQDPGCDLAESSFSCTDCSSASEDGVCAAITDGVCDPDCIENFADEDCGYVPDASKRLGEYVETMVQSQNNPQLTISASGSSVAEESGVDYCFDNLGGNICSPDERCAGEEKEYAFRSYCCIGDCVQYSQDVYFSDRKAEEMRDTHIPLSEIERLYNFTEMELRLKVPAEEVKVKVNESLSQGEILPEQQEKKEGIVESVTAVVNKLNFIYVAGVVLIVSTILILILSFASRGKKQNDLQAEIDSLVSQGKDYKAAEQILVGKGFEKSFVDAEINRNYQGRLEIQKLRQVK